MRAVGATLCMIVICIKGETKTNLGISKVFEKAENELVLMSLVSRAWCFVSVIINC